MQTVFRLRLEQSPAAALEAASVSGRVKRVNTRRYNSGLQGPMDLQFMECRFSGTTASVVVPPACAQSFL